VMMPVNVTHVRALLFRDNQTVRWTLYAPQGDHKTKGLGDMPNPLPVNRLERLTGLEPATPSLGS
jgi:hypothetical protein